MSKPKAYGLTDPDERSVAVVQWLRLESGGTYIRFDDPSRVYCHVPEEEATRFEEAATAQEWKYAMVGYNDFLDRRTYRVDYMPPQPLPSIDPTNGKDVERLRGAINRMRKKRFNTDSLLPEAEKVLKLATRLSIGQMQAESGAGATEAEIERIETAKNKGADRAVQIYKAVQSAEACNQADEHFDEKNARLDAGLATENVGMHKTYRIDSETADKV